MKKSYVWKKYEGKQQKTHTKIMGTGWTAKAVHRDDKKDSNFMLHKIDMNRNIEGYWTKIKGKEKRKK